MRKYNKQVIRTKSRKYKILRTEGDIQIIDVTLLCLLQIEDSKSVQWLEVGSIGLYREKERARDLSYSGAVDMYTEGAGEREEGEREEGEREAGEREEGEREEGEREEGEREAGEREEGEREEGERERSGREAGERERTSYLNIENNL